MIEVPRLHHEAARLPDGGWYTLTNSTRRVDGMPLDYERTTFGRAPIADPTVVRLAADGTTVATLCVNDEWHRPRAKTSQGERA